MRAFLLDTTPLTALLNNRAPAVAFLGPYLARDELATSIVAYAEVIEYLKGAPDVVRRRTQLR